MALTNSAREPKVPGLRRQMGWILVSDPGLQRFKMAGRTTVSVAVAVLVAFILIGQKSQIAPLFGAILALMGSLMVNDPEPKEQKITTLLLIVPAALSTTLGALLAPITWLSDAGLVGIIFLAFYLRRFGPRFMAIGMMALIPFFFSSILGFELAQLPWLFAASVIGVASIYLFRFVLLPDRPERTLRRSVSAFHFQLGITLDSAVRVIEKQPREDRAQKKLRWELRRLNSCATTAESQLAAPNFDGSEERSNRLRLYLFDTELSAHMLSGIARRLADPEDDTPPEVRSALLRTLRALCEPLRNDGRTGSEKVSEALAELERSRERLSDGKPWTFQVRRAEDVVRQLLRDVGEEQDTQQQPYPDGAEEQEEKEEEQTEESGNLIDRLQPTTIQGIQAALAAGLAEAVGTALFPGRSYWVVIAAFVVFARTRSVSETFARGVERTAGTLLGVVAGFFLATAVTGDLYLEVVLVFACIFMAFYLASVSYALVVFWITSMLGILYSLLGHFSGHILEVRFTSTLVGAAIGIAVSVLVFPAKATDKIRDGALDFLDSFGDYIGASVERLAGGNPTTRPGMAWRSLDGKLQAINQSATTLKRESTIFGRSAAELDHLMTGLMAIDHYAQPLASPSMSKPLFGGDSRQSGLLRELGDRLTSNLDALREAVQDGKEPKIHDAGDIIEQIENTLGLDTNSSDGDAATIPADEQPDPSIIMYSKPGQEDMLRALYYLMRINRAITDLASG